MEELTQRSVSMKAYIDAGSNKLLVDGASIRVMNRLNIRTGIVVILPKVEILIGSLLTSFIEALDVSRLPIALNRTISKGNYETYNIIRLATGNVHEAIIGILSVYSGVIVGVNFNKKLLQDKVFRQKVALSAMHQIVVYGKESRDKLFNATKSISLLTGADRESLIVSQTVRTIRVRVNYRNIYNIPLYYIFSMTELGSYALSQISYDYNEIAKILRDKGV